MKKILLCLSKINKEYFYWFVFIFNKIKFSKKFKIKRVESSTFRSSPTNFLFLAEDKENDKVYILKSSNFFSRMYHKSLGLFWVSEKERCVLFRKISKDPFLSQHIPTFVIYKKKIFFEYIDDAPSLDILLSKKSDFFYDGNIQKDIKNYFLNLHKAGFVHGDIKLKNILISQKEDKTFYIIDWDDLHTINQSVLKKELNNLEKLFNS